MQVKRTDKSPTEVILEIEASTAEIEPIKRHVLHELAARAKIPGFRAGKAPLILIEKHLDQKLLLDTFMEHALSSFYSRAIDELKLRPVSPPQVSVKRFVPFSDLAFETETAVIGDIQLPNYKQIKLAKPRVSVTVGDVEATVKSLQTRTAQRQPVERSAAADDEVIIDFEGRDQEDKPIAGASGKDYPLRLGSGGFIPGFEENLAGLKAGEEKEFKVKFPPDYSLKALQNKAATFKVTVKKVHEVTEPKLDDAWAAKIGPFKSVTELRADIKKQLLAEKQWQAGRDYENQLIQKIVAKTQIEVPDALINDQIQHMEEEERRNLTYRGQTWQEHLAEEGITHEQHRQRQRPEAEQRVKAGLVLSEIAEKEALGVTDEEIDLRIQILKGQYQDPAMQAELDKPENRRDLTSRILTEKTLARLVGYATN